MRPGAAPALGDLLRLGAAAALLFGVGVGWHDLWNPNEPLYGQAVVEMVQRGDWLVPRVNGEPFGEKPILYFWLARAAAALGGGADEGTLRLPSVLSGVALVLLVYVLVRDAAGRLRARLAAVLLATTFVVFWSARSVQMDLLLAACTLGAIVAATRAEKARSRALVWFALAGVATGLGLLAKGPVALVVAGLPVAGWLAVSGRARALLDPRWLLAGAAAAAVGLPWFVWLDLRGHGDLLVEMLWRQNVTRFHEPWDHEAPWWYFLYYFWIDMAPWSIFVPLAVGLRARSAEERSLERLAWVWLLGTVAFFSLSESKRSAYLLPAAPAVAVLVSGVAERWLEGTLDARRAVAARALSTLLGLAIVLAAALLAVRFVPRYAIPAGAAAACLTLAVLVGCAVAGTAIFAPPRSAAPGAVLLAVVTALYLSAALALLPAGDRYKSARPFAEAVRAVCSPLEPLAAYRPWKWRASYVYYARRTIAPLGSLEDLARYWARPERVCLLVEGVRLDEAREVLGQAAPLVEREIGGKRAYLFANR